MKRREFLKRSGGALAGAILFTRDNPYYLELPGRTPLRRMNRKGKP
jgi:hypothetical protein